MQSRFKKIIASQLKKAYKKAMVEDVRGDEDHSMSNDVKTSKPTKETWLKARVDYETGNFTEVKEIAERYSINYHSLREKASREKWKRFDLTVPVKVCQMVEKKAENRVELFFNRLEEKAERYEKMLLASQQALGATASDGTPLLDPDALDTYSKVESRVIDWHKTALGITDKLDVTSGGKSLGEDIVAHVEAMYERKQSGKAKSHDWDVEKIIESSKTVDI